MPIDPRYKLQGVGLRRDVRPWTVRTAEWLRKPDSFQIILGVWAMMLLVPPSPGADFSGLWPFLDLIGLGLFFYIRWFLRQLPELPFKLPAYCGMKDKNNPTPGKSGPGKADGILFLGNVRDGPFKGDELWLTNSDARTHILFLGTTGAGKTEGLKSLVTNAMCWGSGFVYVDGKAQNTLWGDIYSLARRFGRDDDVLVLNYMTGNSDAGSQSNSLNPFSIGSASYLTQMMVGLMDDSGDDNAMWKGRAISLMSALMPALTWKRDNQGMLMDVGVIRDHLGMPQIIKMSRDPGLPDRIIRGLQSYLDTLPGYVDSAFDDEGNEKPQSPDQPMVDLSQTRQQHGYLTMQFTRSLSSLADEYGYIFKQQLADIDMMDVVLNRRILVVLIPALEKSPDEAANLGKIVVAALKGMMGATLGADLEGDQSSIIDNNPTRSDSPFMTVFDEVGYYTSPGMGVMAAQARSLGFSLVFAGQDMPALQKRVKEEALSITGNCNLKIFGKLEDPTETKDFFEKTVASAMVSEVSGFSASQGVSGRVYSEGDNISFQAKKEASYDDLRRQREGQVHFLWADKVVSANMFHASPPRVEAIRVQRFLAVSPKNWSVEARDKTVAEVVNFFRGQGGGRAPAAGAAAPVAQEITWMLEGYNQLQKARESGLVCGAAAVGNVAQMQKRRAADVVPSNVGVPPTGQGHWPFGSATEAPAGVSGAPAPPPLPSSTAPAWMGGGAAPPPPASGMPPSSSAPPWMGGAPAFSSNGPPPGSPPGSSPMGGSMPPPGTGAPPPPWASGAGVGMAARPATPPLPPSAPPPWAASGAPSAPPPPWTAGGAAAPAPVPVQQPSSPPYGAGYGSGEVPPMAAPPVAPPPYQSLPQTSPPYGAYPTFPPVGSTGQGQNLQWGSVMGGVPGMGTPPSGARMVQAPAVPPPPPWLVGQPGGQPPQPPFAPPTVAPSPYAPPVPPGLPPWAGGAVASPPGVVHSGAPPLPQAVPPQGPPSSFASPAPAVPGVPPAAPPLPAVLPPGGLPPVASPSSSPPPPDLPQDVDAILRNAAGNLSDEMFPSGHIPGARRRLPPEEENDTSGKA